MSTSGGRRTNRSLVFARPACRAQAETILQGIVSDPSGAAIISATVPVVHRDASGRRQTRCKSEGRYVGIVQGTNVGSLRVTGSCTLANSRDCTSPDTQGVVVRDDYNLGGGWGPLA